jgi:hypothetical protein
MLSVPSIERPNEFVRVYAQQCSTHQSGGRPFLAAFSPKVLVPAFKAGAPASDEPINSSGAGICAAILAARSEPGGQRLWR